MKKYESCGNCNNGWKYRIDKNGEENAIKCSCLALYQKKESIRIKLGKANISTKVLDLDLDESYIGPDENGNLTKIKKYVEEFKDKFSKISLYFWSEQNSTQKTTIASIIGKELIIQGFKVRLILMDTLIKLLQDASFDKEKELALIDYSNADLLIIDDCFDKAKMTVYKSGYQFAFIDSFLRNRMEVATRATIFTSNVDQKTIGNSFNISIQKLVMRNAYPMEFKDSIELKNDFNPEDIWE